jgi:hypothetical protein
LRLAAALLLAACSRDPMECPSAAWSSDATPTAARGAFDGTVVMLFGDAAPTPFAGVVGPALVRLDATGNVAASASIAHPPGDARMWLDDAGAPVVVWANDVTRFDRSFALVWTQPIAPSDLDVAPAGQVVYTDPRLIHYLDAAGAEQWTAPNAELTEVRAAANGDVFTFDFFATHQRQRLAAAGGAVIETVAIPPLPMYGSYPAIARDGSFVFVDDPFATVVTGVDATGAIRWTLPLHTSADQPTLAGDGTVIAVIAIATQIIRLDAATGAIAARHDNCGIDDPYNDGRPIIGASSTGYVLLAGGKVSAFAGP